MKISVGPRKPKKEKEAPSKHYQSPSGRDDDNTMMVKMKTGIPGVRKWKKL